MNPSLVAFTTSAQVPPGGGLAWVIVTVSLAFAAVPPLLYFILRYARGLARALDGYRVAKPKAWL